MHPSFAQPASWLCLTPASKRTAGEVGQQRGTAGGEGPVVKTQQQRTGQGKVTVYSGLLTYRSTAVLPPA